MNQKLMMNQLYNVQFEWKWIVNETNFKNIKMKNGKNWKPFNCTVGKCIKKLNWTEGVWNMLAWWKFISVSIFWDLHVCVNDLYWFTALGGFCDCHHSLCTLFTCRTTPVPNTELGNPSVCRHYCFSSCSIFYYVRFRDHFLPLL